MNAATGCITFALLGAMVYVVALWRLLNAARKYREYVMDAGLTYTRDNSWRFLLVVASGLVLISMAFGVLAWGDLQHDLQTSQAKVRDTQIQLAAATIAAQRHGVWPAQFFFQVNTVIYVCQPSNLRASLAYRCRETQ